MNSRVPWFHCEDWKALMDGSSHIGIVLFITVECDFMKLLFDVGQEDAFSEYTTMIGFPQYDLYL